MGFLPGSTDCSRQTSRRHLSIPPVMPQYARRRYGAIGRSGPLAQVSDEDRVVTICLEDVSEKTIVVPAIEHLAMRRTGRVAANHTLVSRSPLGTPVSTPSKSNNAATKFCSRYLVDLVPGSRECLSRVLVSVLIFDKNTDVGPVIDECVSLKEFMGRPERNEDLERGYLVVAVVAV